MLILIFPVSKNLKRKETLYGICNWKISFDLCKTRIREGTVTFALCVHVSPAITSYPLFYKIQL